MQFIRKSVFTGLCLFVGITSLADDLKALNILKLNYEKISSMSNEELKKMSFEKFKTNLGFYNDFTPIFRKDMDSNEDAENFNKNLLIDMYQKYCNLQNGTLYGRKLSENVFYSIEQKETNNKLDSDFGREVICMDNKNPIFFGTFDVFFKKCHFACNYKNAEFSVAEFVLSDKNEKLNFYKNQYDMFLYFKNSLEEKNRKDAEVFEREKQLKILKAQEINNKIQVLRNRNGNTVMEFYTGFNGADVCETSCKSLNRINTGYSSIEESVENGWIISQVIADSNKEIGYTLDSYGLPETGNACQCKGKKYFMQKTKN